MEELQYPFNMLFVTYAVPADECVSRCGVYTEGGQAVPILSGAGLFVEDADHNEVFLMKRAEVTLDTVDTTDFADVVLEATYIYNGVEQNYQDGGMHITPSSSARSSSILFP